MGKRQKALLWRIPLATTIIFGLAFYIAPNMDNRFFTVASIALFAFDMTVVGIITEKDRCYYDKRFGAGSFCAITPVVFGISFVLGAGAALFMVLPATHSLLWMFVFASVTPYAVLVLFALFYFIFAFDKR